MSRECPTKVIIALVFVLVSAIGGVQLYQHRHYEVPIVAGPGVTRTVKLSEYHPALAGTIWDTNVFFMEGSQEGGAMLVMGGTHSNEIASVLAAHLLVETAVVEKGTLIVIPNFNNSGGRNTRPGDGYPLYFSIPTDWGEKKFRMGNRDASPLDQWPDPDVYIHYPTGQSLSFADIRNTNRTWPGRPDGVFTEQLTYAAMQLMRTENVNVAIDMHGAETMYPVTNCIVAPASAQRLATMTSLYATAAEGFDNHVEPSPAGFRGLSHREIGDHADVLPFLLEAPIPFLDQPTGPKTEEFLLSGKDPFLLSLSERNMLFVPYDAEGWPIENRVGQHASIILELANQYSRTAGDRGITITGVPRFTDIVKNGVGRYFQNVETADQRLVHYQ